MGRGGFCPQDDAGGKFWLRWSTFVQEVSYWLINHVIYLSQAEKKITVVKD